MKLNYVEVIVVVKSLDDDYAGWKSQGMSHLDNFEFYMATNEEPLIL